ncbi:MAG: alpha/beta hydrolase-fold protein [Polyangiaceae bacterium]
MPTRRELLSLLLALSARSAHAALAEVPALSVREIELPKPGKFGRKCLLLRPTQVPEDVPLPLLVLFHGLGETSTESLGIRAWYDRYGLPGAYARLSAPPVQRTLPRERYLSDARLAEINQELTEAPFEHLALLCPFTPNVFQQHPSAPFLDRYADYIEHAVLPAARAATATSDGAARTGVDGVSLGGYVALEVFLRKAQVFGVIGCTQGAFGSALADVYARRLAEVSELHGARAIHLSTSTFDPFRRATERLGKRLAERGVTATLTLGAGPHDQRFLREAGTLELLLFQARALHRR